MKFVAVPLTSFEDATFNFEQLQSRLILDALAASGAVTWAGGTPLSNTLTVAHGLGVIPRKILLTADSSAGNGGGTCVATYTAVTAGSFGVVLRDVNNVNVAAASPGNFSWLILP